MAINTTAEMTEMVAMPAVVCTQGLSVVASSSGALYLSTLVIIKAVQATPAKKFKNNHKVVLFCLGEKVRKIIFPFFIYCEYRVGYFYFGCSTKFQILANDAHKRKSGLILRNKNVLYLINIIVHL